MGIEETLTETLKGILYLNQDLLTRIRTLNLDMAKDVSFKVNYSAPSQDRNYGHLKIDVTYNLKRERHVDVLEYAFFENKWSRICETKTGKMFF